MDRGSRTQEQDRLAQLNDKLTRDRDVDLAYTDYIFKPLVIGLIVLAVVGELFW